MSWQWLLFVATSFHPPAGNARPMCEIPLAGDYLTSLLNDMLAKITSKNQLTLPKQVVDALGKPSHFEVEVDGDRLVLTPSRPGSANAVRRKLQALGLQESDVTDAVAWARTPK